MSNIRFRSEEHVNFYSEMMNKCGENDSFHRAFFYVMGISPQTRANINQMFDFRRDSITPDGIRGGWQTSGSMKVCNLAFNLWNGYTGTENDSVSPYELFDCEYAPFFIEGIKIKYSENFRELYE